MRSLNRFWSLKTLPSKLLVCFGFVLAIAATEVAADEENASSASTTEVWVPAEVVASDPQVAQASFEEPVKPTSQQTGLQLPIKDAFDPGLIVPLEEMQQLGEKGIDLIGSVAQAPPSVFQKTQYLAPTTPSNTMNPGTMVPGSMRVLQASNPVMAMTSEPWQWQILPSGLLWHSYLAGPREPRISSTFFHVKGQQDYWDATLGGRVSLLRFGSSDLRSPEGVEIQLEGAAFPRLTLDYDRDLVASDYRFGFPLVYRRGPVEAKFSYYHLSSHLGDEYLISHPEMVAKRINYSRDAFTFALGYFPWRDLRLYGEVGYAIWAEGGSRPWEFQFGVDYSPASPTGIWGAPFAALNGHLHQELNYGGGFTAQAGIQWRGQTGRLLRFGFQYFNGMSEQYQFFRQFEQQFGGGIWYDF